MNWRKTTEALPQITTPSEDMPEYGCSELCLFKSKSEPADYSTGWLSTYTTEEGVQKQEWADPLGNSYPVDAVDSWCFISEIEELIANSNN